MLQRLFQTPRASLAASPQHPENPTPEILNKVWTNLEVESGHKSKVKQMIYIAALRDREITAELLLQYSPCSLDPCMAAT